MRRKRRTDLIDLVPRRGGCLVSLGLIYDLAFATIPSGNETRRPLCCAILKSRGPAPWLPLSPSSGPPTRKYILGRVVHSLKTPVYHLPPGFPIPSYVLFR